MTSNLPARQSSIKMSKGGHGAAAASVLMLKKSEDRRQESALREAFKVNNVDWVSVAFVLGDCEATSSNREAMALFLTSFNSRGEDD